MERRYAFNWQESTLLVRASDYDALAQRLAEAERRIRAVQQKVSPDGLCNPGWQDALQELYDSVNADSATVPLEDALWESLHGAPWPGPHGVCPDGTPHMPKNGECIKCRNAVTVSEVTK
jgi:hypothetical protein